MVWHFIEIDLASLLQARKYTTCIFIYPLKYMDIWKISGSIPTITSWSKRVAVAPAIVPTFHSAEDKEGNIPLFQNLSKRLNMPFLLLLCWQKLSHLATLNYKEG